MPLPNGSALAIGGLSIAKGGVLNSTELFTPASNGDLEGTWTPVAAMNTPRQDFAAVLLDDGTVLAFGGFMASTEIYDPSQVSQAFLINTCTAFSPSSSSCVVTQRQPLLLKGMHIRDNRYAEPAFLPIHCQTSSNVMGRVCCLAAESRI